MIKKEEDKMDYDIIMKDLGSKKEILNQYSLWLENSEVTKHCGVDIFNRIRGVFDSVSGKIVEDNSLIRLLIKVQIELKIDLGVCKFFNDNDSFCSLSGNFIVNPVSCIPPLRGGCKYRKKNQEG